MCRLTVMVLLALCQPAAATTLLDERFSPFTGNGVAPGGGAGTLDSLLWSVEGASDGDAGFGETRRAGDLARGLSTGGVRGGGLYAFELPGNLRAVGVQSTTSDFTPGALTRRFVHAGVQPIRDLSAALDLWVLNDGPRSTRVRLQVASPGAGWREVPALSLDTPGEADELGWQYRPLQALLPLDGIAPGAELLLRWGFDDRAGTGARDEIALSGLRLEGAPAGETPVALSAPGCAALLAFALAPAARRRHRLPERHDLDRVR